MLQPDLVLKEQPKTGSKSPRSIMERLKLSEKFAGIRIDTDDESDEDVKAMREKYLLGKNDKSKTLNHDSDEIGEKLEMNSEWNDHFQNLLKKCKSLTPGICFSYLGEDSDSELVDEIQGIIDRLDHDTDDLDDDNDDDDDSNTAARDKRLDNDKDDDDDFVVDNASDSNTAASPKLLESETCEKPVGIIAEAVALKTDDEEAVIHDKTDKEPEHIASDPSSDLEKREIAESKTENVMASSAEDMSDAVDKRSDAGDSTSKTADNHEAVEESTKIDECSETIQNKAMPAKTVAKTKDAAAKVVKKFDIKPSSSFPLDELLPVIEKTHAKSNETTEVLDDTKETDLGNVKSDDKAPTQDEHPETFHGSLFDYSDSENEADKDQPEINPKDINTRSTFIQTGLIPNKAQVSSDYYGVSSSLNAQQYGYDEKPRSVCFDINLSESTIPTYISERPTQNYYTAAGRRNYNIPTGSMTNANLATVPMNDLDMRRRPVNEYNLATGATNAFDMVNVPTSTYYLPTGTINAPNMPTVQMNPFDTAIGPMPNPNFATVPLNAFDMARRQINESTMASGMLNAPNGAMNVFDLANGTINNTSMYNQSAMAPSTCMLYNPNVATGAMNNFNITTGTINNPSSVIGPTSPLKMATGVKNDFNTATYSSNTLPVAPDTSKIIQNTLNEIDVCDSPEECEMLLNTLNEQCSKLVASDEERFKLNEMIAALRAKVLDVAQAKKVLSDDTAYTPADPIIENVGPAGDSFTPNSTESDLDIFEGRTLLKGGVEPRRIPKTTVKTYKTRPQDPRTYNTKKETVKIPLPQFSVQLNGEKRVLRMMYLDWDAYSKEKGIVIDDSNYDANADDDDGDIKAFHEVTSPALDSMKYTLKTGNIEIAVQESFMGLNSTSLTSSSEMLAKLHDKDTISQSSKHSSESTKVNAQPVGKVKSEDSNSNDYLSKVVSDWQSKQRAHNQGEKSSGELEKPEATKNADIPDKMEVDTDNDLEDGQVVDSLSDVSSRNTILGATPSDRELSDVEVTIVIPDTLPSFEKRNIPPSQDHLHHSRERTSSKSTSRASSISKESSSVTIPPHKSRPETRPEKRDHSTESFKPSGRYENYFLQVQENHKKAVEKLTKRKDSSHSSHSSHHYSKEPSLPSVEHQKHASHKQASRDSHSITSYAEAPHAMKRHHSLEEVGTKKRHKSGDMLANNETHVTPGKTSKTSGKTSTVEPVVYFDLTNDSKAQIPHNNSKPNVHERLGNKKGHKTATKYQNTHTPTSHLGHSNLHRVGLEQPEIPNPKTPVHERLGKPNVHNRLGYFTGQESSGSKNKTPSKKPIHIEVNHQFTIPGLNAQNLTKNSTPQAHKDQISKEYHEKYTSRRKPEISEPSQPVLVPKTKRRKSLEEQQKEKEDDLIFLQQLKSKITGKK